MEGISAEDRAILENPELRYQSVAHLTTSILLGIRHENALIEQLSEVRQEFDKSLRTNEELQQQLEMERKAKADLQAQVDQYIGADQSAKKRILQLCDKLGKSAAAMGGSLKYVGLDPVDQLEKEINGFLRQLNVNGNWDEVAETVTRMRKVIPELERNTRGKNNVPHEDVDQNAVDASEEPRQMESKQTTLGKMNKKKNTKKKRQNVESGMAGIIQHGIRPGKKYKRYNQCLCKKTFSTEDGLRDHVAKKMKRSAKKKLVCPVTRRGNSCKKRFNTPMQLSQHIRFAHCIKNVSPQQCDICCEILEVDIDGLKDHYLQFHNIILKNRGPGQEGLQWEWTWATNPNLFGSHRDDGGGERNISQIAETWINGLF